MTDICLLHGWGVNRVVWQGIEDFYAAYGRVRTIDLPGYGKRSNEIFPDQLDLAAQQIAEEIPVDSIVIAWSLGGTLALYIQSARLVQIRALQLIAATPKFVRSQNWPAGQQPETFAKFLLDFKGDYLTALRRFISLQLQGDSMNSDQLENWMDKLNIYPRPSKTTLINGLNVLNKTDLREDLALINIPTHIVYGKRDRVCHPKANIYLHESIANSQLSEFNCGHLPFYSCIAEYKTHTGYWLESLGLLNSAESECI